MSTEAEARPAAGGPGHFWKLIDGVATVLSRAYVLARCRAASHPSPIVRLMARRHHAHAEACLLERELAVLRAQRASVEPGRRPHYRPEQRAEALQVMRLRGWSACQAAERFVVHANTIRAWQREARGEGRTQRLLGQAPWNKLHEGVRWLVHELRRLCPEREFGTRTIARHILRAGIRISRASVRRILTEPPPERPRRSQLHDGAGRGGSVEHLLRPSVPHRVWHLDLTSVHLLWLHLRVAALVDGCSRKLLALRVYKRAPGTAEMVRLVHRAARANGRPRFLITDHGDQFRRAFEQAVDRMGVRLVRGRVGCWRINAKVERLFRTLKLWQRLSLLVLPRRSIQRRLDNFRGWYNRHRPHSALGVLTPDEAACGCRPPRPIPIRVHGPVEPRIRVTRRSARGDPHLPVIEIGVSLRLCEAA